MQQNKLYKETDTAKTEFNFYLNSPLDMIGNEIGVALKPSEEGVSALQAWIAFDTHGKIVPCREPEVLAKVLRSKKSVNLQIKLWAEDLAQGILLAQNELIDYVAGWPNWVLAATMQQAAKIAKNQIGFVPRFLRIEHFMGSFWLPEMDAFDASI